MGKLCVMALNEGVIDKHVIGSLVEARIGSLEQLDTAQFIADKVLVAYSERIKTVKKIFNQCYRVKVFSVI